MAKSSIKLILLLLILGSTVNLEAQSYKLRYNFSKGKTYRYSSEFTGDFTQQVMGQEIKMANSGKIDSKFVVNDVEKNGNMILIVSIDSGTVKTKSPMKDTTLSLTNFSNKRTKTYLAPSGKIVKTEIIDTIKSGLESIGLTQRSFMQFAKLPEKEVKAGESWNSTDADTIEMMGGKIVNISNLTYTFAGLENKFGHSCLKLNYSGDVKNNGKAKVMGMDLFIEGTGKTSGTVYVDAAKGLLVATEGLSNTEMTMATTGEQNMIIPMTQSIKMSQNLIND